MTDNDEAMDILIDIILKAGRSAVELALFVLLPVMVVMLSLMRLLEARGALDWLVAKLAPVLKPFGLTGLGVFAALQINFVSFAAPMATLTMMEQRGTSDRHLAATLAMVFAMAQANASLPMLTMGLELAPILILSLLGGLTAAVATYYFFGRQLSASGGARRASCRITRSKCLAKRGRPSRLLPITEDRPKPSAPRWSCCSRPWLFTTTIFKR